MKEVLSDDLYRRSLSYATTYPYLFNLPAQYPI